MTSRSTTLPCSVTLKSALPSVVVDPHQLEQVYLNIINNAADAMLDGRNGGVLRIKIFRDNRHVVCEFHDFRPRPK